MIQLIDCHLAQKHVPMLNSCLLRSLSVGIRTVVVVSEVGLVLIAPKPGVENLLYIHTLHRETL